MKITIETSESERVTLQPENKSLQRQGQSQGQGLGGSVELLGTDAGPPGSDLLQALGERGLSPTAAASSQDDRLQGMDLSGGGMSTAGSTQSRH